MPFFSVQRKDNVVLTMKQNATNMSVFITTQLSTYRSHQTQMRKYQSPLRLGDRDPERDFRGRSMSS